MKKIFFVLCLELVSFGYGQNYPDLSNEEIEIEIRAVSNKINSRCPIIVDSVTTLLSTLCLGNNTFVYKYELKENWIDKESLEFKKQQIINAYKTNPVYDMYQKYKTKFEYYYNNPEGEVLGIITIDPNDYVIVEDLKVSVLKLETKQGKTYYNNELFTGDSYGENDKGMFICKYINGELISKKCLDSSFNEIDCP